MSNSMPSSQTAAALVPDHRRGPFLPDLFGREHFMICEVTVFHWMESLSPDYTGGFWNFYEWGGQPLYLAPTSRDRYRLTCQTNGFDGEGSADCAGIIATLFALSHLSFQYESEFLSDRYHRLYGYAAEHPEARTILGAID